MAKLPSDKFLELLRRSELVEAKALDKSLADFASASGDPNTADADVLCNYLINASLISKWQRDKLMDGRHKGFFLGKYKLLGQLGSGGMASVYLAEHKFMHRRVAIKVLPKNKVDDSSYLQRFYLEARAAAALDHSNIVRAFDVDFDSTANVHYLVMEYVEGSDLQSLVKNKGPLPYEEAAEYVRQAADGLAHAHQRGLIHRDIKPANLLVDLRGTVKVLDMGLARFADDDKDASLTVAHEENVLGTADYLAPEQAINSHTVDSRADIYSLGGTLYYLLTGHPPFPEGTLTQRLMKHQNATPAPIAAERAKLLKEPDADTPQELIDICSHMMAKKPEERFQSAQDLTKTLGQWLAMRRGESNQFASMNAANSMNAAGSLNTAGSLNGGTTERAASGDSTPALSGGGSGSGAGLAELPPMAGGPTSPFQDTAPNGMPTVKVMSPAQASAGDATEAVPQIVIKTTAKKGGSAPRVSSSDVHDFASIAPTTPEAVGSSPSSPRPRSSPSNSGSASAKRSGKGKKSTLRMAPPRSIVLVSIATCALIMVAIALLAFAI